MKSSESHFSRTLGQVTTFLLKQKIVKNDTSFKAAVQKMITSQVSSEPEPKPTARLLTLRKLETQKTPTLSNLSKTPEKQIKTEQSSNKFLPKINQHSKELVKNK